MPRLSTIMTSLIVLLAASVQAGAQINDGFLGAVKARTEVPRTRSQLEYAVKDAYQNKDFAFARECLSVILAKYPSHFERDKVLYNMSLCDYYLGEYEVMTDHFAKAVEAGLYLKGGFEDDPVLGYVRSHRPEMLPRLEERIGAAKWEHRASGSPFPPLAVVRGHPIRFLIFAVLIGACLLLTRQVFEESGWV